MRLAQAKNPFVSIMSGTIKTRKVNDSSLGFEPVVWDSVPDPGTKLLNEQKIRTALTDICSEGNVV